MYEVREYFDGYRTYYCVFIKCESSSYCLPPNETDNMVIKCVSRDNAEKIKDILEMDEVFEEFMNDHDLTYLDELPTLYVSHGKEKDELPILYVSHGKEKKIKGKAKFQFESKLKKRK